jgi:hypothetical protein
MLKCALAILGLLAVLPGAASAQAARTVSPALYCEATGGTVQTRIPTYGTNGGTALPLSGPRDFCQYASKDGTTQIYVLLTTLFATKPSLAALAYYAKVKFDGSKCVGAPGSCYCSQIGGTDLFGGINAAGGGWVLNTNNTDVLDACIFPDLSVIDSYGLFYHSAGIIRGQNLDHLLRYPNPYK